MQRTQLRVVLVMFAAVATGNRARAEAFRIDLEGGWSIQSSAKVAAGGEALSKPGSDTSGWHRASVPTTVVARARRGRHLPRPLLRHEPPRRSPGRPTRRQELLEPADARGQPVRACPGGIAPSSRLPPRTRQARRSGCASTASTSAPTSGSTAQDRRRGETAGACRTYELDVTGDRRPGAERPRGRGLRAPQPDDLAITFVDWNPMPPDKVMGLYRAVTLSSERSGRAAPPAGRHEADLPALDRAELTVKVFARNATGAAGDGHAAGRIGAIAFEKAVPLAAGESREVVFTPAEFPQLVVAHPRLWWPAQYGTPNLHRPRARGRGGGRTSDRADARSASASSRPR